MRVNMAGGMQAGTNRPLHPGPNGEMGQASLQYDKFIP
jgi:hypothetical protein